MDKKQTSITSLDSSPEYTNRRPLESSSVRIIENFRLVWLEESSDGVNNISWPTTIAMLHQVINSINTFSDPDQCVDFISDIEQEKVFLVICETFCKSVIPVVQEIPQISSVYIFSKNSAEHKHYTQQYPKIKGVFTDITHICQALRKATLQCEENLVSMSFIAPDTGTSEQRLDQLDSSFMYTQILKEILLTIEFKEEHIREFASNCRQRSVGNTSQLKNIDKFEQEYHDHVPIWWYTHGLFLYSILNQALRNMEVNITVNMGFFLQDLHQNIVELHSKQYHQNHPSSSFTVYRGQGLSKTDFDQLLKTQGGLMSFNNFVSTSKNRTVSLMFAESNSNDPELIGVLFQMTISSSISTTPFANISDFSRFPEEEEILFSMPSVFRIEQVDHINNNNRLWQVNLRLTSDNDPELHDLTQYIRKETFPTQQGWYRLGQLMNKLGRYDMAERMYTILLGHTTGDREKASIYHQLLDIKNKQGNYAEAIKFYEISNEIMQSILPPNHPDLATSYNSVATVYENMGEYLKALAYRKKDLAVTQKVLSPYHPDLATSYNNIGLLCDKMGEYSKALSYYEKALEIRQQVLPSNHPELTITYNNIGRIYFEMSEYMKAFFYYEKALDIRKKTLPSNHPDLAISYTSIGSVYGDMGEYSKALSYYEKDLGLTQKMLPSHHPDLATSYNNIGLLYDRIGEYLKAISYHEKALEIYRNILPTNPHGMIISYNNIGGAYSEIGQYSKAISYCEKALDICQETMSPNHPDLATYYSNTGAMYDNVGDYSKTLSYYEKALDIRQKTLPPNHPDMINSYNNIGQLFWEMGQYSKAFSYHEKALDIAQKIFPSNHPTLATVYNNIGIVYSKINDYSKALSYFKKAYEIHQKTLP